MAEENKTAGSVGPPAPPTLGSGDARLDAILEKKKSEKLNASDRGYLAHINSVKNGTWKPGTGRPLGSGSAPKPNPPPSNNGNPLLSMASPPVAPPAVPVSHPVDPALVERTTRAILKGVDSATQRLILSEARKAGADANGQVEIVNASKMSPEQSSVIAETMPDALASMGMDLSHFAVYACLAAIGSYGVTVLDAVSRLRELQAARIAAEKEAREARKPNGASIPKP